MSILVDSSIWIDYFRGVSGAEELDYLIEENLVVTNELILTELIPPLHLRKKRALVKLLQAIKTYAISPDWEDLRHMQIMCLSKGINAVGIPDLIIAQNAIQHHLQLYTRDKHFDMISQHMPLMLYPE